MEKEIHMQESQEDEPRQVAWKASLQVGMAEKHKAGMGQRRAGRGGRQDTPFPLPVKAPKTQSGPFNVGGRAWTSESP